MGPGHLSPLSVTESQNTQSEFNISLNQSSWAEKTNDWKKKITKINPLKIYYSAQCQEDGGLGSYSPSFFNRDMELTTMYRPE